jgi:hypothetical protein
MNSDRCTSGFFDYNQSSVQEKLDDMNIISAKILNNKSHHLHRPCLALLSLQ